MNKTGKGGFKDNPQHINRQGASKSKTILKERFNNAVIEFSNNNPEFLKECFKTLRKRVTEHEDIHALKVALEVFGHTKEIHNETDLNAIIQVIQDPDLLDQEAEK